jgi:hypothetical protein|tara:strand:+ start:1152 stop:1376 length:225 start_codon:yes stop_codon:yes gene_type:complete
MRFPDPPTDPALLPIWAADLVRDLNQAFDRNAENAAGNFTPTTTATNRVLPVATASLADVGNVLGTLIKDLQGR